MVSWSVGNQQVWTMLLRKCHLILIWSSLATLSTAQDYDDEETRGPYEFQFRVDDPETYNKYEIQESGDPDVVTGSYRINLPDGRTQVVNYQVHPERGYEAKITYEGDAQYPGDNPGYFPNPYGPPEPLRPGYEKFKRESILQEAAGETKPRTERKVEIKHLNNSPLTELLASPTKKIAKKKVELELKDEQEPESVEKLKFVAQKKVTEPIKKKESIVDKVQEVVRKTQEKIQEHQDSSLDEVDHDDGFYDTKHTPQAEPLSLRQTSKPTKIKKKPSRSEYKPAVDLITKNPALESKSIIRRQDDVVFVPLIYEAVPSLNHEEKLIDNVFKEVTEVDNDDDKGWVEASNVVHVDPEVDVVKFVEIMSDSSGSVKTSPGVSEIELISRDTNSSHSSTPLPTPTLTNTGEKNHRKRKIYTKDYSSSSIDPYSNLLKQDFPTIYRSQLNQDSEHGNIVEIEPSTYHYREGKENAHLYQTLF